jgi:Trypsin
MGRAKRHSVRRMCRSVPGYSPNQVARTDRADGKGSLVLGLGRRRRTLTVAGALLAAAGIAVGTALVGGAAPAGAVANGVVVPQGQYRFAVKFTFVGVPRPDGSRSDSACSGALIAPQWVISAGHCFHDAQRNPTNGPPPYTRSTVTIGKADVTTGAGFDLGIKDVRQNTTEDVALVELTAPVQGIQPLQLPRAASKVGDVVRIAGYGATDTANAAPSNILRTGVFTVTQVTSTIVGVTGRAPAANTSACLFDSGAAYFTLPPLFRGFATLTSVESTGPDCPHAQQETTSRVDTIVPWIRQQLASP